MLRLLKRIWSSICDDVFGLTYLVLCWWDGRDDGSDD